MAELTPWENNIVWQHPDGSLSITHCAPGTDVEAWRDELIKRGDAPKDAICAGVNMVIPPRSEFRNALAVKSGSVQYDMARAAELHRETLRRSRGPLLAALDVEYQRADEIGDAKAKAAIAKRKQALRDVTKDPRLDAARTLDDLRAVKCAE